MSPVLLPAEAINSLMFSQLGLTTFFTFVCLVYKAFADSTIFVYATDARINYSPPLYDAAWSNFTTRDALLGESTCVESNDSLATADFTFYGTSLTMHGVIRNNYAPLIALLDGDPLSTAPLVQSEGDVVMFQLATNLEPTKAHRIIVQKSSNASSSEVWNLLFFRIGNSSESGTVPSESPSIALFSPAAPTSSYFPIEELHHRPSRNVILGVTIAVTAVLGFAALFFFIFRRRHLRRHRKGLPDLGHYGFPSEERQPRILMSYNRLQVSSLPGSNRHYSTATTVQSNEIVTGSIDQPSNAASIDAANAYERSSEDRLGQEIELPLPSPRGSNDPFESASPEEPRQHASLATGSRVSLTRGSYLPSITPPPSYHTADEFIPGQVNTSAS